MAPDGRTALALAVAALRRDIASSLDDAASRSAVVAAEAAAERFKSRQSSDEPEARPLPHSSAAIVDSSLSRLDAIEVDILSRQNRLLTFLSNSAPPELATDNRAGSVGPDQETDKSPTLEFPAVPAPPTNDARRDPLLKVKSGLQRGATIAAGLGMVVVGVVVFLLAL